jgi:hypothetical protein
MNLQEILLQIGIETKLLIAGLIGSIAGITGKNMTFVKRASAIFTGVGGAIYLTPLASELLGLSNEQSRLGIAVLIGYLGITGMQNILLKKIDQWKR